MAALSAIFRDEVEVISRHIECARIARRPQAYESTFDIAEVKFPLLLRGVHQPCPCRNPAHRAGVHCVKGAVDFQGVEEIIRLTMGIARQLKALQTSDSL